MIKSVDIQQHREQTDCYRRCQTRVPAPLLRRWGWFSFHFTQYFVLFTEVHNKSVLWLFLTIILCLCLLCDDNFNLTDISNWMATIIVSESEFYLRHSVYPRLRVRARVATNWRGSHRSRSRGLVTNLRLRRPRVPDHRCRDTPGCCETCEGGAGCFYLISDQF